MRRNSIVAFGMLLCLAAPVRIAAASSTQQTPTAAPETPPTAPATPVAPAETPPAVPIQPAAPARPAAAPTTLVPAPAEDSATAELKRKVAALEKQNAHLQNEIDRLRKQFQVLADSYNAHFHVVNGVVGNGVGVVEGKTLVTGTYADIELRQTGGPQPPYFPPSPLPAVMPGRKVAPGRKAPATKAKPAKLPALKTSAAKTPTAKHPDATGAAPKSTAKTVPLSSSPPLPADKPK